MLLRPAAFVLLSYLRVMLARTGGVQAPVGTLRRDLLKSSVRDQQSVQQVLLQFASSCPVLKLWPLLLDRLPRRPRLVRG